MHITVADGENSKEEKNLTRDAVLERFAISHQLKKPFRCQGFEFHPTRLKRFQVTKTAEAYDAGKIAGSLDGSSLVASFQSAAMLGQKLSEAEDVTNEILTEADQLIVSRQLKPASIGAFDVPMLPNKAFVIMAFSDDLRQSYEAIAQACKDNGIEAVRADSEVSSASIIERILRYLKESSYIIADLTNARPNVYYEIGYFDASCEARGIDSAKHLLFVTREMGDLHFDLRHRGVSKYDNPYTLLKTVKSWLEGLRKR